MLGQMKRLTLKQVQRDEAVDADVVIKGQLRLRLPQAF